MYQVANSSFPPHCCEISSHYKLLR